MHRNTCVLSSSGTEGEEREGRAGGLTEYTTVSEPRLTCHSSSRRQQLPSRPRSGTDICGKNDTRAGACVLMDRHTSSVSVSEVAETRLENKVSFQGKRGRVTPSFASHISCLFQSPRLSASSLAPPRKHGLFVVPPTSDPSARPQQAGPSEGNDVS